MMLSTSDTTEHPKQIHELVERASKVIAHYWPMTSFVHHNPIRSLETLPFDDAVKVGKRFIGGQGYLDNESYRKLLKSGRITQAQLNDALRMVAREETVEVAGRAISHADVLRAHMQVGIAAPAVETVDALVDRSANAATIRELSKQLKPNDKLVLGSDKIGTEITLAAWCDQSLHKDVEWAVNKQLIKWCGAFLDEGHASWPMPYREKGFYEAWRKLAALEWSPCAIKDSAKKIRALPQSPADAVLEHLDQLEIPYDLREAYLSLQLAALHGWASFINWRSEQTSHAWQTAYPIDLVQYLAVRLFYERELVEQACRTELRIDGKYRAIVSYTRGLEAQSAKAFPQAPQLVAAWRVTELATALGIPPHQLVSVSDRLLKWMDDFPESEHGRVWLRAYEAGYQEKLLDSIVSQTVPVNATSRPDAQMMFCIDVRSEPFRRSLESKGNYETIGFAGFFGIPVRCRALDQFHLTDQAPAIVPPKYTAHEVPRNNQEGRLKQHNSRAGLFYAIQEMLHDMKTHVLTPYIMVEAFGWLFGIQLFGRTLFPAKYRQWRSELSRSAVPPVATCMTVDRTDDGLGLTQQEQCVTIETVLRTMGLTSNFARLVVICGHCSQSDNNPYEAALNCGACGGNSGEPNARLFAAMANKPYVREHLAAVGIVVPADTHFLAAVHNTTTDGIKLYDLEDVPDSHRQDVERLRADLQAATVTTNRERCAKLPGAPANATDSQAVHEITRRAGDWSETRPEWGLAGNAAYIIGRRALTKNINLAGRTFLNSYDHRVDPTGNLLESIMLGPMVVGQWINAEHYFSATDTEVYGSGSKIYHNVVGRVGIMSGPQSDLRTGLAWQSMMNGDLPYHEPMRLLVVIEAPRQRILEIVERQPILKQLCDNEWIHLVAVDPESDETLFRYRANEGWRSERIAPISGAVLPSN